MKKLVILALAFAIPATAQELATTVKATEAALGIYMLEGANLKLCLAGDPGAERPRYFEAPEGSRLSMLTLIRVKDGQ